MPYSKEYLNEWERREELLRALHGAADALSDAIRYERNTGNSSTADRRMEALFDHLDTIKALQPKQVIQKYASPALGVDA